jgi:predicted aspartyl protease
MTSPVSSSRVPYIPVTIEIPEASITITVEALVDTGFNGEMSVPSNSVSSRTPALGYVTMRLADETDVAAPAYLGNVRIGETTLSPVTILALGNEAVVGLGITTQFRVTIDHARSITFEV